MKINEIINIIKSEPFSILIIFSLLILPSVFLIWTPFFPEAWKIPVIIIIIILWILGLLYLRRELLIHRRKVMLFNYLKKEKRHSFEHLSNKWAGKNEFTEKNIRKLVMTYLDIFKYVKVISKGEKKDGVGLVKI